MPTISYRDVLSRTFDDKELVEFLVEFLGRYKEFGAFRLPALPSHVTVTLIDRIKHLEEQQLGYYAIHGNPIPAANQDTFEEENPPDADL
jgi:hypothetical protein